MPADVEAIRTRIDLDELNYPALARELGPDALPALQEIARDPNVTLAAKAIYLVSLIGGSDAAEVIEQAAEHPAPVLRVAVAAALRNLGPEEAEQGLDPLLGDDDPGVRKVALRTAAGIDSPALRKRVQQIAQDDTDPGVRAAAQDALGSGSY